VTVLALATLGDETKNRNVMSRKVAKASTAIHRYRQRYSTKLCQWKHGLKGEWREGKKWYEFKAEPAEEEEVEADAEHAADGHQILHLLQAHDSKGRNGLQTIFVVNIGNIFLKSSLMLKYPKASLFSLV